MRFEPKSEKELAEENLLAEGDGNFEVIAAEEKTNEKHQCPALSFLLKVWDTNGKMRLVREYLLMNQNSSWKFRQFCYSANLQELYAKGEVEAYELVGASGRCTIKTEIDRTGQYDPQSKIKAYVVEKDSKNKASGKLLSSASAMSRQTEEDYFKDDGLPDFN